jgi:phosphotransacetylase
MTAIGLQVESIIEPVLIGDRKEIERVFQKSQGFSEDLLEALRNIEIVPRDETPRNKLVDSYRERKAALWETVDEGRIDENFPANIVQAAQMLSDWEVDAVISGAENATRVIIMIGKLMLWVKEGSIVSSGFLMQKHSSESTSVPKFIFSALSDKGIDEEANSIIDQYDTYTKEQGIPPQKAILSYATYDSASSPEIERIKDIVKKIREKRPDIILDGPLQFDAAIDADVRRSKTKWKSSLTWVPDILILPDDRTRRIVESLYEYRPSPRKSIFNMGDGWVMVNPTEKEIVAVASELLSMHEKLTGNPSPKVVFIAPPGDTLMEWACQKFSEIYPNTSWLVLFDSPLAQEADIYIFPDLSSGNIGYKMINRLWWYDALGPILTWFNKLWLDLSRWATQEEINKITYEAVRLLPS